MAGYNHKQAILLSKVISKMTNFTVDRKRFEIFKEMLSRQLKNFRAEQPHTHAMYYTGIILDSMAWTRSQIAEALESTYLCVLETFISHSLWSHHLTLTPLHPPSHPHSPPLTISPSLPSTHHLTLTPLHSPSHPHSPPPTCILFLLNYLYSLLFFSDVTCEMLQSFITNFFSHSHIEALLHGNLTKEVRVCTSIQSSCESWIYSVNRNA